MILHYDKHVLRRHGVSSKSSKGKKLMLTAKENYFVVSHQKMYELQNDKDFEGTDHGKEVPTNEILTNFDSPPTRFPNFALTMNESLIFETAVLDSTPHTQISILAVRHNYIQDGHNFIEQLLENDQLDVFVNNDGYAGTFQCDNISAPFLPSEYLDITLILAEDASNDESTFYSVTENLSFVSDITTGITELTSHHENLSSLNFNRAFLLTPRQLFPSNETSENTFSHLDISQTIKEHLTM